MTSEYCCVEINNDNNCTKRSSDVLLCSYKAHINALMQELIWSQKPTLSTELLASKEACIDRL